MRKTAGNERKYILAHQLHITENLIKACRYMSRADASNVSSTFLVVIDELNALWSYIDSFQNVLMKRLLNRYGLCRFENELETCSHKIFLIIEKMKGAVNQWMTELAKNPPDLEEDAYLALIDSSRTGLFNALSEYYFRTLTALDEVVVSSNEKRGEITDLLKKAKYLKINERWASSSLCLIVQEIAAKRRIRDLGCEYTENRKDPQGNKMDAFRQLLDVWKTTGKEPPEILIAVAKSWAFHRARLLHEGCSVDKITAQTIFEQTSLFLAKIQEK